MFYLTPSHKTLHVQMMQPILYIVQVYIVYYLIFLGNSGVKFAIVIWVFENFTIRDKIQEFINF